MQDQDRNSQWDVSFKRNGGAHTILPRELSRTRCRADKDVASVGDLSTQSVAPASVWERRGWLRGGA